MEDRKNPKTRRFSKRERLVVIQRGSLLKMCVFFIVIKLKILVLISCHSEKSTKEFTNRVLPNKSHKKRIYE